MLLSRPKSPDSGSTYDLHLENGELWEYKILVVVHTLLLGELVHKGLVPREGVSVQSIQNCTHHSPPFPRCLYISEWVFSICSVFQNRWKIPTPVILFSPPVKLFSPQLGKKS